MFSLIDGSWLASARHFLFLFACGYALLILLMFMFQSRLLYYPNLPSRKIAATPDMVGLTYEPVKIVTDDGVELDGWYLPAENARGVLIFFHGNAGNISHRLDSLEIFNGLGLSTLIVDYRGYGRSQGKVSEQGTYRDAEAVWRYLSERNVSAGRIIVFGRSLGAAIAAHLATRHTPAGLILESSFTSVPDFAARTYWYLPARWLARFNYNTEAYLKSVKCPVLIVHSQEDDIIPFKNGQELFDAASEPKQFLRIRGNHNEGFMLSGQTYVHGLDTFLTAYLGGADSVNEPR